LGGKAWGEEDYGVELGLGGALGPVRCMRVIEKEICAWVWEMMDGDHRAVLRRM